MSFVEQQILPRYNAFGRSHGLGHVQRVIKSSLQLASMIGADLNMSYVIAAYHDLGMEGPRILQVERFCSPMCAYANGFQPNKSRL